MTRRDLLWIGATAMGARAQMADLKARVSAILRTRLDSLFEANGAVMRIKGKSGEGLMAACFEMMQEASGDVRYRRAAVELADRVLAGMKRMPVGVLAIKEKEKPGESVMGGGPPALGWYAATLGHVYQRQGGRGEDIVYVARVLDRFPWNPKGWWAATVDVTDGHPPVPLDHPSPINKNCAMAMACAVLSEAVKKQDSKLSESLRTKTMQCLHEQIFPAQLSDGFWHYGLTGNDPNNKDVHSYFMLTTELLISLARLAPWLQDKALTNSLARAEAYAVKNIAPNTAPYTGSATEPKTRSTPVHYDGTSDPKHGYMLSVALVHGKYQEQAARILGFALDHFPPASRSADAAHCAYDAALCL